MKPAWRSTLKWMRVVHIYATMLALLGMLFFSFTGFLLIHAERFGLEEETQQSHQARVDPGLLTGPDRLALVEHLRKVEHLRGAVDDFDLADDPVVLVFRAPGRRSDVTIERDGAMEVVTGSRGMLGRLMDLHTDTHAGPWWWLIADGTAMLLMGACLTGLVLYSVMPKRRVTGAIFALVGIALCLGIYMWLVP